jgi:hypothetical protein
VRIGEVDRQSGRLLDALVMKHLVALVQVNVLRS